MAKLNTDKIESPFYPPRARWYGRLFHPWFRFQRRLHLDRLHLPTGISPLRFLISLVVPGFSFVAFGRPLLGASFLAGWSATGLVFVGALGYPAANFAFALVISAHAISIYFLELHWLRESTAGPKVGAALATLLVVGVGVYLPLLHYSQGHWVLPLHVRNRVVVAAAGRPAGPIHRGDWLAYPVEDDDDERGVYVARGLAVGPVLAVAGDRIEFEGDLFRVNGEPRRSLPHMPASGGMVVPENHWFIWPDLDIRNRGNGGEAAISATLLRLAMIPTDQVVAKPFKRWFWRRQIPP